MGATAAAGGLSLPVVALARTVGATGLRYSDGITMIELQGSEPPSNTADELYPPYLAGPRHDVGHLHWLAYTEGPDDVPGKYRDGNLAQITRSQTFKQKRGETQ